MTVAIAGKIIYSNSLCNSRCIYAYKRLYAVKVYSDTFIPAMPRGFTICVGLVRLMLLVTLYIRNV